MEKGHSGPVRFGFVLFEDKAGYDKCLEGKDSHMLRGKWVDVKPVVTGTEGPVRAPPAAQTTRVQWKTGEKCVRHHLGGRPFRTRLTVLSSKPSV